jgi:hypothetical protein
MTDDPHAAQRLIERAAELRRKRGELEREQEALRSDFSDPKFAPVVEAVAGPAPPRGLARTGTIFDQIWERLDRILQSGAFYFFAGLGMLLYAFQASNAQEHPSLTFLIAMLGFAIMLFGTGSQAAGAIATSGARLPRVSEARGTDAPETGAAPEAGEPAAPSAKMQAMLKAIADGNARPSDAEKAQALGQLEPIAKAAAAELDAAKRAARPAGADWTPVKANAAIAGGAAVLTAIFGVGVIHFSEKIRDVFNDFERYEIVSLQACSGYPDPTTGALVCNPGQDFLSELKLDNYAVRAVNARGVAVPIWQDGKRINILVFRNDLRTGRMIRLVANRLDDLDNFYSKEVDVMISLADPAPADGASGSAATKPACVSWQTGPACRLSRLDLPPDQEGRVKTTYFSLNFAQAAKREDETGAKFQFQ